MVQRRPRPKTSRCSMVNGSPPAAPVSNSFAVPWSGPEPLNPLFVGPPVSGGGAGQRRASGTTVRTRRTRACGVRLGAGAGEGVRERTGSGRRQELTRVPVGSERQLEDAIRGVVAHEE